VLVCSLGAIVCRRGDRSKTDMRDALKLARLVCGRRLRPVVVWARELGALRDVVCAREDLRGDLNGCA